MSNTNQTPSTKIIVQDNSAVGYLMDTGRFEHCLRIAKLMASASLIPDHLKINPRTKQPLEPDQIAANCFMIVNQAFRWEFDPFGVAPETYVVGGKLAFQGKLVAAAINARAGLEERLNYTFEGKPGNDDFTVIVSGRIKGEKEPRTVRVSVGQAKTDNQMWKKDPEQKLIYTGAIKWARRHTPEIILGVLIEDEVEEIAMRNVTPTSTETDKNPYEDAAPVEAVVDSPPPKKKAAAKPSPEKKETPSADPDPEPKQEEAAPLPSRKEMYNNLKELVKQAEISPQTAEARLKKANVLPKGKTLAETTDEELFEVMIGAPAVLLPKNATPDESAP